MKYILPRVLTSGTVLFTAAFASTAFAQQTGQTTQSPVAGFFYQLFMSLGALSMLACIAGYFRPDLFRPLFKRNTSKGVVCGTFGAALLLFAGLGSSLEPKPVVTPQERAAKAAQAKAETRAKEAEQRAAAAEARAKDLERRAQSLPQEPKRDATPEANAPVPRANKSRNRLNSWAEVVRDDNPPRSPYLISPEERARMYAPRTPTPEEVREREAQTKAQMALKREVAIKANRRWLKEAREEREEGFRRYGSDYDSRGDDFAIRNLEKNLERLESGR